MSQSLADLFGASATQTGATVTINFTDFATASGLDDATTAAPSKLAAAYLVWLRETTKSKSNDKTAGVAADDFQPEKTFVSRGDTDPQSQIVTPVTINLYSIDNTTFDADNVI